MAPVVWIALAAAALAPGCGAFVANPALAVPGVCRDRIVSRQALLHPFDTPVGDNWRIRTAGPSEDFESARGQCSLLLRGPPAPRPIELAQEADELQSAMLVLEDLSTGSRIGMCGAMVLDGMVEYFVCGESADQSALDAASSALLVSSLHSRLLGDGGGYISGSVAGGWDEASLRLLGQGETEEAPDEMVDWVDRLGVRLLPLPRKTIHDYNLLHRGAGVMVTSKQGEIYVHQRAGVKRVFPSLYDMFVGGVCSTGESTAVTAARELSEELGLHGGRPRLRFLFRIPVATSRNRCLVDVYGYECENNEKDAICWQPEEVAWGKFVEWEEVCHWAAREPEKFVPDGLQVWAAYLDRYNAAVEKEQASP
jgi:8-oxo-dGTP pyrophosphatase MutT (NUDIX family)